MLKHGSAEKAEAPPRAAEGTRPPSSDYSAPDGAGAADVSDAVVLQAPLASPREAVQQQALEPASGADSDQHAHKPSQPGLEVPQPSSDAGHDSETEPSPGGTACKPTADQLPQSKVDTREWALRQPKSQAPHKGSGQPASESDASRPSKRCLTPAA